VTHHAVRLYVTWTDHELASLPVSRLLTQMTFSSDGGRLMITSEHAVAQVWDLRRLREKLAEMNLDWDQPPVSTTRKKPQPGAPKTTSTVRYQPAYP
jgi:hypothetical protein